MSDVLEHTPMVHNLCSILLLACSELAPPSEARGSECLPSRALRSARFFTTTELEAAAPAQVTEGACLAVHEAVLAGTISDGFTKMLQSPTHPETYKRRGSTHFVVDLAGCPSLPRAGPGGRPHAVERGQPRLPGPAPREGRCKGVGLFVCLERFGVFRLFRAFWVECKMFRAFGVV